MWEVVLQIVKAYGIEGIVIVSLLAGLYYTEKQRKMSYNTLLRSLEQRVEDNQKFAEEYRELSENTHQAIDTIIKVVRKNNGQ